MTFRIIVLPHISPAKFTRDIYSVTKLTVLTLHPAWQYIFYVRRRSKEGGHIQCHPLHAEIFYTREVGRKQVGTFNTSPLHAEIFHTRRDAGSSYNFACLLRLILPSTTSRHIIYVPWLPAFML